MEVIVQLTLIHQLGVFGVADLKLDGNFEVGLGVDALVDLAEGSLIEFLDNFVVLAYFFRYLRHRSTQEFK